MRRRRVIQRSEVISSFMCVSPDILGFASAPPIYKKLTVFRFTQLAVPPVRGGAPPVGGYLI
jgi:hypothetical protein